MNILLVCACALMSWASSVLGAPTTKAVDFLMPDVQPQQPDTYLCRSIDVSELQPYITEFIPNAQKEIAHHILLYGCTDPGSSDPLWNCGEMASTGSDLKSASVCASGFHILYAWAMDAPKLKLPKDVAFKVGGDTGINKLVLQVHYKNVSTFLPPESKSDSSGITLVTTNEPKARTAGVYLMDTGGTIPAHSIEYMETACPFREPTLEIHPFAYRTHSHALGRVISGYRVRDGQWTEIGRMNPQNPQMFYNVTTPGITVKKGDILAARCTMENNLDHDVSIGSTQKDEMCNFYIMYFVDGDKLVSDSFCAKPGPPNWYFTDYGNALNLEAMPETASTVPDSGRTLIATAQELQEPERLEMGRELEEEDEDPAEDEVLDKFVAGLSPREVDALVNEMMMSERYPASNDVMDDVKRQERLADVYEW
ncbi:probable peptidylglycine alpha-hydroxylating monooxygenase 1 isoform X2 [Littorina saxatilis]|uniref:peptidylglycine monooxygenase n=2 Tax=Littorina saxatilis TaxID=31220 RepID=A0AAN9C2D3_9CAEN